MKIVQKMQTKPTLHIEKCVYVCVCVDVMEENPLQQIQLSIYKKLSYRISEKKLKENEKQQQQQQKSKV